MVLLYRDGRKTEARRWQQPDDESKETLPTEKQKQEDYIDQTTEGKRPQPSEVKTASQQRSDNGSKEVVT
ncbi:hypothetical protein L6452_04900 [Arctium lappa]|uniref:Uncharacterized protein n=1 Tax=Arctium lappa TaxID=4217 RepID=A0ACB9EEI5_ARCLA|nr:hypothetical protein L6452_04900 [Arctium lappa]